MLTLALALMGGAPAQAETRDSVDFAPHWFVQPQVGVGYHVGEAKFSKLLSPAAQLNAGRQFTPEYGLRFGLSGWEARNWQAHPIGEFKWNYVQTTLDVTFSLPNLIAGYKANRKWNVYAVAGIALNIEFNNDDAIALAAINESAGIPALTNGGLQNLWDGTKVRPGGRLGLGFEYNLSKCVALGLEYNANALPDLWDSKAGKHHSADWQQNLFLGVKVSFGKKK